MRFWWNRFGAIFAAEIRWRRVAAMRHGRHGGGNLDEFFVKINGVKHSLSRAVDHEGEGLDSCVKKRRDKKAALKVLRKSLRRHGGTEAIVTDRLASCRAVLKALGAAGKGETGRWLNNRAENSQQPFRRRERAMLRFRRMRSLQTFAALHGSILNHFYLESTLGNGQTFKDRRTAALAEWWHLCAA